MTLLPRIKLKAAVNFPASVLDGTGIDVTRSNGSYRFDLDFADFAPPVGSVSDAAHQNALLWNSVTGSYTLAPMALLSGGSLPDAPNDGTQYGRQSLGWTPIVIPAPITPSAALPVMDGTAIAGVATAYSRGDHVHPTDTSRAPAVFVQAGTGAVNRTPQDKMRETVSTRDFGALCDAVMVTITASITTGTAALTATGASFVAGDIGKTIILPGAGAAGAVLTTTIAGFTDATHITLGANAATTLTAISKAIAYGTDDTINVQKAVTSVIATGGNIKLSGRSLITAPIVVDYTANTQIAGLQNTTVNFYGNGSGNSQLLHSGFTGTVLDIRGKIVSGAVTAKQYFEGFSIQAAVPGVGRGMLIDNMAYASFTDIAIYSMGDAFTATDLLTCGFFGCAFLYGVNGIDIRFSDLSRPNAISFYNTTIASYNQSAIYILGGAAISFFGGSIEFNGVSGSGTRYLVNIDNPGVEGGMAFAAYGVHIEANHGNADFLFNKTSTDPSTIIFDGCDIQRGSSFKTTNNILIQQNAATTGKVDLVCRSSFRHFAGYTPSGAEPAIRFISDAACEYAVDASGSYFGDNLYRWGEALPTPWAVVKFTGATPPVVLNQTNVDGVTRNSIGNFTVNLRNTMRSANPVVIGISTDVGWVTVFNATTTTATIRFFNAASALADPTHIHLAIYDGG